MPADDREQREVVPADPHRSRTPVRTLAVRVGDAHPDDREVRDRERQHRAERVHVSEEVRLAGDQRQARDPAEQDDPDPRRPEARMQPAQRIGHLAVQPHRVDEPGDTDDPGVRGDEQDRRREQPDIDLAGVLERPEVQVLDDPEHRVAGEASLVLAETEQRLALAARRAADGQRAQRDGRQQGVDREHGDHDAVDRPRDRFRLVLRLLGHVRDRLDPGVGDHPHGDRHEEVLPRRSDPELDVVDERMCVEHEEQTDEHEQQLGREVGDGEQDVDARPPR